MIVTVLLSTKWAEKCKPINFVQTDLPNTEGRHYQSLQPSARLTEHAHPPKTVGVVSATANNLVTSPVL